MFAIYKREMRAHSKSLFFWVLGVFLLIFISFIKFESIATTPEASDAMVDMMPQIIQVMFGMAMPLYTPQGYFIMILLWIGLAVFLHAALLGASLISKEQQDKTADFLLVRPLRREKIVLAKALAGIAQVVMLNAVIWLAVQVSLLPALTGSSTVSAVIETGALALGSTIDLEQGIYLALAGLLLTQVIYLVLGMLGATASRSPRHTAAYAAIFVLLGYLLYSVVAASGEVDFLGVLTPFWYFFSQRVLTDGLSAAYLGLSAVIVIVGIYAACALYRRRDVV